MAERVKRSVSMPPDLDARIAAAAAAEGMSYSAWLARGALRELTIRDGLAAVAEHEAEQGAFTPEELAEAERWYRSVFGPQAEPAVDGAPAA
jgi:hypothetical protein